ncbi:hypothetical protein HY095_04990 [Candidatus Micrarchaeota archaeon]|nr:hypothetical protein [Candidatus Micrarchaeota archaeon]
MAVYSCSNCNFRFAANEAKKCPRCDSTDIREFQQRGKEEPQPGAPAGHHAPRPPSRLVYGDGKGAWRSFHSQQASVCPNCGGKEFELNYKRKEKTCRKCGDILPLPRRFA